MVLTPTETPASSQKSDFDALSKSKHENNKPLSSTEIKMNAKNNNGDNNTTTNTVEISKMPSKDILSENNKENNTEITQSEEVKKPQRDVTSKLSDTKAEEKSSTYSRGHQEVKLLLKHLCLSY